MVAHGSFRWRKTTDINREHALFELLDGETSCLDVGFSDNGVFEASFNPAIVGKVIAWDQLSHLLNEGRNLAEKDRAG